tara:strand:+ start:334 stop:510 length:177 start_codon:yes stop_codon:yes gene_type:complete
MYSKIATCITSVLLNEVPTTKFENLNKYNRQKVNRIWNTEPKNVKRIKLEYDKITEII